MTAPGQLDIEGNEQTDPRVERAARALWWRDAKRAFGQDGHEAVANRAKALWPRIATYYREAARVALDAADKTA